MCEQHLNNAFLPKVNVPDSVKTVNLPEGFRMDSLKDLIQKTHQEYA